MSLQVLVSHTGERLLVNPTALGSLDTFKSWLSNTSAISPPNQILLTASGKQAKQQALLVEREIFVYDRELISSSSRNSNAAKPLREPSIFKPKAPPNSLQDQNDLSSWQKLFANRNEWAADLARRCHMMADDVHAQSDALVTMHRSVSVAIGNLQSHVRTLEQKYGEAKSWVNGISNEQDAMLAEWEITKSQLSRLPADVALLRFLPKLGLEESAVKRQIGENARLDSFVSSGLIGEAVKTLKSSRTSMQNRVDDMANKVRKIVEDAAELVSIVESDQSQSTEDISKNTTQLLEEIDVIANKIKSDLHHVQSLVPQPKNLSQASKMALLHTRNYLPTLEDYAGEMGEIVRQITENGKDGPHNALDKLKKIAAIEAAFAKMSNQISHLGDPSKADEALELLALLSQLPFVYGTLLIEAVRRGEWADRLKGESSILAEDIAGYREEEMKRRKKWIKSVGNLIDEDAAAGDALNFELNLRAEGNEWPNLSREDSSAYLQSLGEIEGMDEVVKELAEAVKDLDRPTKRQIKKAKGFKMGSFHEASSGRGSFLLRENDELRIARDANTKLEDELKSQKSRIRKLEDLLHKQGQASRANSANLFQGPVPTQTDTEHLATSPKVHDSLPRKPSISSHVSRLSEERDLARRIVTLEAELTSEKQRNQDLEQQIQSRTDNEVKTKLEAEEATSTKKDLMENMEAQQREFASERRSLEEELDKYKTKIEEFEEEVDRLLESRDNAKATTEEKERVTEQDLEETKRQTTRLQDEITSRNEQEHEFLQTLTTIHSNLTTEDAPTSMQQLVNALDDLVGRSIRHFKDLEQTLAQSKSDKESVQAALDRHDKQAADSAEQIQGLEETITSLRNESATERARADAMLSELDDGRSQLRTLRAKFAEGETGSEALRQRVEEQAARASSLATLLAESKSHVNSLDVELSNLQRKHKGLQKYSNDQTKRLENRSIHDREMMSRLVGHNEELRRLLETLGLSIIEKEGAMAIQRTSKLNNASTELSQLGMSSIASAPSVINGTNLDFSPASHLTQWMQADSVEQENSLFQEFLGKLDVFNYNTFSEAIIKLRRDIEWTGKKWKSEARSYRDKYHRAQSEGFEKIAFRSFKEGDLALFLPTRNQFTRPWAAFNVGAPHYFLREQDSHNLPNREWLVARVSRIEKRVVNLSKTVDSLKATDGRSIDENSEEGVAFEDDNPFGLSDGLRWYLIDATEERVGAPATPGLGKTTVASANVDAKGSIRMKKTAVGTDASSKLNKNLESRRSSTSSKRNSISINREGSSDSPSQRPSSAHHHTRPGSQGSSHAPGANILGIDAQRLNNEQEGVAHSPVKSAESVRGAELSPDSRTRPPPAPPSPTKLSVSTSAPSVPSNTLSPSRQTAPKESAPALARPRQTAFESLWSLDLNLENGRGKNKK